MIGALIVAGVILGACVLLVIVIAPRDSWATFVVLCEWGVHLLWLGWGQVQRLASWVVSTVSRWLHDFVRGEGSAPYFWGIGALLAVWLYAWALVLAQ